MDKKDNESYWRTKKANEDKSSEFYVESNDKESKKDKTVFSSNKDSEFQDDKVIDKRINKINSIEKDNKSYIWKDSKRNKYKLSRFKAYNERTKREKTFSFEGVKFPKGDNDFVQLDVIIKTVKYDSNGKPVSKLVRTLHSSTHYEVDSAVNEISERIGNMFGSENVDVEVLGVRVFVFYENEFKIYDSKKDKSKKKSRK